LILNPFPRYPPERVWRVRRTPGHEQRCFPRRRCSIRRLVAFGRVRGAADAARVREYPR